MKMQQEEKLIEASLEAITSRVQEVRDSIQSFLARLEREQMNWPSVLDNFALLSGQVSTLTKLLKGDKTPALRNLVLLPVLVQQEPDNDLQKLSQGRIPAFNHEVVPDYLRTKYEPEVEEAEQTLVVAAANITQDNAQKQINYLNELLLTLTEMITSAKDDWEGEQNLAARNTSSTNPDIATLVGAVTFGKGLKPSKTFKGRAGSSSSSEQQGSSPWSTSRADHPGKHPSSIKTELKAASSPHPYAGRPPNRS